MSSTIRNCRQPEDLNEFLNPVGDIIEGYGNVTPKTNHGRIFVIIYGLIGIPLSMLAIANLGKFLSAFLKRWTKSAVKNFRNFFETGRKRFRSKEKQALVNYNDIHDVNVGSWLDAIVLLSAFFLYLIVGSVLIAAYEKEMDFFGAIYFNFVSLTTIGLGDLIPKNENYLAFTIIYCIVGLSLTTIAIEIASEYLKKLHFFGRKLENVGNVQVWFGGKMLTMKQLVRNLGDQFNLPENQIIDLNLDQFVDDALKVEAGELPTLRVINSKKSYSSLIY
ncbi:unnamed protein product [Dracunculus medinensis]|uniref:Ion_trans_2 domain-containing protein n=1 Tax=Dracunculus medinensis TaxID=318479 RepID=A0A0N4U3I6_DRAME|nr:unnamed protein product [Dracunculus medinensis]